MKIGQAMYGKKGGDDATKDGDDKDGEDNASSKKGKEAEYEEKK